MKVAQAASGMFRPLTSSNVESHLKNVGLDAEFATFRPASKFKLGFNSERGAALSIRSLGGRGRVSMSTQAPPHLGSQRRPEGQGRAGCRHVDAAPFSDSGRAHELLGPGVRDAASEAAQIWARDHPSPSLMETSRLDGVPSRFDTRRSLGALADAIREFEGGVVIISHNNDFTTALCPETWVVEKDEDEISRPNCRGDPEWMKNALVR